MTPKLFCDRRRGHVDHTMHSGHQMRHLDGDCGQCFLENDKGGKSPLLLFNDALCSFMMRLGVLTRPCHFRPYISSNPIY